MLSCTCVQYFWTTHWTLWNFGSGCEIIVASMKINCFPAHLATFWLHFPKLTMTQYCSHNKTDWAPSHIQTPTTCESFRISTQSWVLIKNFHDFFSYLPSQPTVVYQIYVPKFASQIIHLLRLAHALKSCFCCVLSTKGFKYFIFALSAAPDSSIAAVNWPGHSGHSKGLHENLPCQMFVSFNGTETDGQASGLAGKCTVEAESCLGPATWSHWVNKFVSKCENFSGGTSVVGAIVFDTANFFQSSVNLCGGTKLIVTLNDVGFIVNDLL